MRYLRLALTMLRYRAALTLWIFFLIGIARHGQLTGMRWSYLTGLLALAASYVAATTVNDICDQDVDAVNHPGRRDRPLVFGNATVRDIWTLHGAAIVVTLVSGVILGPTALLVVSLSLLINHLYSMPPIRVSRRTLLAPPVLAIAYVLLPYWLGTAVSGQSLGPPDAFLLPAFLLLFLARINLKDFRDRAGDARSGKPTLVLRYGKRAACLTSLVAALSGNILLLIAVAGTWWLAAAIEVQMMATLYALFMLWRAEEPIDELFAISLAARMGNGMLLTVLAQLTMSGIGAATVHTALLVLGLTAVSCASFFSLTTQRADAVRAYRG